MPSGNSCWLAAEKVGFPWIKNCRRKFFGHRSNVASGGRVASEVEIVINPKEKEVNVIIQLGKRNLNYNLLC